MTDQATAPKAKKDPNGLIPKTSPARPQYPIGESIEALLEHVAAGGVAALLMLLFWKQRHANPSFTFEVAPAELEAFNQCVEYLEVSPIIKAFQPGGVPAQEAIPAQGHRRAVPGRSAIPPKDLIVVQMVGADGNAFVPVENNHEDRGRQLEAERLLKVKDGARRLAAQLGADLANQTFSSATVQEAITALNILAGLPRT